MLLIGQEKYTVRKLKPDENRILEDYFYNTFYVPDNIEPLPREILRIPYYQKYFCGFGNKEGDYCFVAQENITKKIVGAVWTRFVDDTAIGIDCNTPFLLISVDDKHDINA